ncbi:hypothetical protein J8273_7747 [Carpediemonas membranifera]|uniref:Uncharacterized protein n=1 Tax=Carpediemonas membranifera TaxID=201153 RepID=A0A8J6E1A8_9EUKA|nr:hypothetical protein J8273_7747 [Carpediemonas membranifera]|eukprot:KAG9390397.1 hypothetical protein J8273_7747 [Carpediemonas membranifera]
MPPRFPKGGAAAAVKNMIPKTYPDLKRPPIEMPREDQAAHVAQQWSQRLFARIAAGTALLPSTPDEFAAAGWTGPNISSKLDPAIRKTLSEVPKELRRPPPFAWAEFKDTHAKLSKRKARSGLDAELYVDADTDEEDGREKKRDNEASTFADDVDEVAPEDSSDEEADFDTVRQVDFEDGMDEEEEAADDEAVYE